MEIKCAYLGCENIGQTLDDVEVAPKVIEKKMVCNEHIGQLKDSNSIAIGIKQNPFSKLR